MQYLWNLELGALDADGLNEINRRIAKKVEECEQRRDAKRAAQREQHAAKEASEPTVEAHAVEERAVNEEAQRASNQSKERVIKVERATDEEALRRKRLECETDMARKKAKAAHKQQVAAAKAMARSARVAAAAQVMMQTS
jgi:hypothetical protein